MTSWNLIHSWAIVVLTVAAVLMFPSRSLYGQVAGSRIKAIEVRGNKRIQEDTIRSRITFKVEDPVTPESIREQIRVIYELGFFEDVRVETEPVLGGVAIVVVVKEKPFITEIVFDGNEELSEDTLQEKITVQSQSFLDQQLVKGSAEKIKEAYEEAAYFNAEVIPIIQSLEQDHKRLTFYIKEGRQTKIKTITFLGATAATKKELLDVMANREHRFLFSWFTDAGILNRRELPNDVERIKEVFMNKGFLNVQVSQPSVDLTEDKEWLNVTFRVVEGEPYTFGEVGFRGNVVFEDAELRVGTRIIAGETFQRALLRGEVGRVTDLYGERGYSFADVSPSLRTDPETKTVLVTLHIEEGSLIRIRRIQITGNDKTRDNVIRRELRVEEQQVIDTVGMKRSFQRLNNLDFFETVEILPTQISPDEVDLDVRVKEKPTGSFSIGGGFSTLDQFTLIANITERNLFGRGHLVRVRGQLGQRRVLGILTFREPHFQDSETSLQIDAFATDTDFQTYTEKKAGGSLTAGRFFSEYMSGTVSLFGEEINIRSIDADAPDLIREQKGSQSSTGFRSVITRDTRDSSLSPRTGWRHRLGLDFATKVLGGSNFFYKFQIDTLKYTPLFLDTRLMLRGRLGILEGLGSEDEPVPERFFVGGIKTIRGFKFGRAGPVTAGNDPEGSDKQVIFNADFIFPVFPAAKLDGVVFFDYGEGINNFGDVQLLELNAAAGFEARWLSPFGPLRAALGLNLDPDDDKNENKTVFEFSVGGLF